jgi:hypothetical protein
VNFCDTHADTELPIGQDVSHKHDLHCVHHALNGHLGTMHIRIVVDNAKLLAAESTKDIEATQ